MVITDLQKCIHIINLYGTKAEAEALDKLRALTWNPNEFTYKESYRTLDDIVKAYMLKTANEVYDRSVFEHKNEWFIAPDVR